MSSEHTDELDTDTETGDRTGPSVSGDRAERLRSKYGLIRGELKNRPEQFTEFDRSLVQARITQSYDTYLSRAIRRAILSTFLLLAVQIVLVLGLTRVIQVKPLQQSIARFPGIAVGVICFVSLVGGVLVFATYYYYPQFKARQRRRRIDPTLPHAIVFMYALSEGGVELPTILKRVSQSEDVFGEVATAFHGITIDLERFNFGLLAALTAGKRLTPSETFQNFLDDLISVQQSGGDLNTFLQNKSESYLKSARRRQESFLETLGTIAEAYVTLMIAGPIFLIIILVIMGIAGENTVAYINVLTYIGIPAGITLFIFLIDILDTQHDSTVTAQRSGQGELSRAGVDTDTPEYKGYIRKKRKRSRTEFLKHPFRAMTGRPLRSFAVTIPVAVLSLVMIVFSGVASPSVAAYQEQPIWTTTVFVVFPLLLVSGGIMAVYEFERRRIAAVNRRFPDVLSSLASANKSGIQLVDCITLVTRRSEGILAQHLERLEADIRATRDVHDALHRFAADIDLPRVTRVVKTLVEADKSSEDLSAMLEITARDTEQRFQLDLDRKQAMQPYVLIFFIGVLVYLGMILVLNELFFPAVSDIPAGGFSNSVGAQGDSEAVPIAAFQTALYHSSIIQSLGNGLLIGKLVDDTMLSGIKYGIPLLLATLFVFHIV
jgi:flagellar protein FlaJ